MVRIMPLYEYRCRRCGLSFEILQKIGDGPPQQCASCGGPVEKQVSPPAIQFKGNGWYVTDYAKKPAAETGKKSRDGQGPTAGAEAKPGAKPPGKPPAPSSE